MREDGFPLARASVARCHGLLAATAEEADEHFAHALELQNGSPIPDARTHLVWGWRLSSLDDVAAALLHYRAAANIAAAVGATAIVDRAMSQLAAAGHELSPPQRLLMRLSADELRVASAVAHGDSIDSIAVSMVRSESAVDRLLASVYEHAGVDSAELLAQHLWTSPADVTIQLLGDFVVRRDGQDVTPKPGHPSTALQYLAFRAAPVHVEELAEILWPDAAPGRGRARLRNVLARIRERAGEVVVRRGDLLTLNSGVRCDAGEFDEISRRALAGTTDLESAAAAVRLYRGELLPAHLYAPWTEAPRELYRRRHLAVVDLLAEDAVARGSVEEALSWWEQANRADPLDDSRLLRAAELLLEEGRRAAAREMIDRAHRLRESLGAPSSPTVADLEQRLSRLR